ncbi:MAG: hypothetical protein JWO10_735 [Microbacteriaceae bacterium]|nr:hypothetical protein [Microbacteriaceae bacterium]
MPGSRAPAIHIVLAADYGNIGDALIYREALGWFRGLGVIHANLGRAPEQWIDQLGLDRSTDVLYRSGGSAGRLGRLANNAKWFGRLFSSRRNVLVFDCGETALRLGKLPKESVLLVIVALARLRGITVVRPPHAVRAAPSPVTLAVYRLACRISNAVYFRDETSVAAVGFGTVTPDLGFGVEPVPGLPWAQRSTLAISLRGHTPYPGEQWQAAVRDFAERRGWSIEVFAQVSYDIERSAALASDLGGTMVAWLEDQVQQEHRVRELYLRSALVLSDRMHVLVYSTVCGAIPVELVASPTKKISGSFHAAGLDRVSHDAAGQSRAELVACLDEVVAAASGNAEALVTARARIRSARTAVAELIAPVNKSLSFR